MVDFRSEGLILITLGGHAVQLQAAGRIFWEGPKQIIQWLFHEISETGPRQREVDRLNREIKNLVQTSQELNRTLELEILYDLFCRLTAKMMPLDVMYVSFYDPLEQLITCVYAFAEGNRIDVSQFPALPLEPVGHGTQSRVIRSGEPWLLADYPSYQRTAQHSYNINNDGRLAEPDEKPEDGNITRSGLIIPLKLMEQVVGVVQIFSYALDAYSQEDLENAVVLASQFAVAANNARLYQQAQKDIHQRELAENDLFQAYAATIEGLMRALDMRDQETEHHSRWVIDMTVQLAQEFGFSESELAAVRIGAQLHDIGKMGVPDAILWKAGPLTDDEWVIMKKHPSIAYQIIWPIHRLRRASDIPYCHHEKWDGSGYPRGLKGEEIPLAARIFSVVDAWDALNSDWPYRAAWPEEKIRETFIAEAGTHFDPAVVRVCLASNALVRHR